MSRNWKIIALALTLMMPITLIGRHYYGYGYGYGPYPYGYAYGPYYGYPYAGPVVYTDNPGVAVGATIGGLFGALASR